ncbi:MAG: ABC transporter permease [Methanobacterium sp.]|jgi:ABC-2 type transport system permease protein
MRFLSIAVKDLKELMRDKKSLTFILIFPIILMIIGGLFLGAGQGFRPHDLAVVNYDQGSILTNGSTMNYGDNLTQYLKTVKYQNSNVYLFNVVSTNNSNANLLLNEGKVDAELIIPQNFSDAMVALTDNTAKTITDPSSITITPNITSSLTIQGNPESNDFGITQSILSGTLNSYQDQLVVQTQTNTIGAQIAEPSDYVNSVVTSSGNSKNFILSYFVIPGLMIFSFLLVAIMVAVSFTRDEDRGVLARLKLSGIRVYDLLFGSFILWTLMIIIQISLILAAARLIGFHFYIGIGSILLVLLVGIIGGIASISLGIFIAALTRNSRLAFSLGIILAIPVMILSVFQLPQTIFKISSHNFQIFDFLPWTHVFNDLQTLLTFGGGWSAISHEVLYAIILTVILFIISMGLYYINKLNDF